MMEDVFGAGVLNHLSSVARESDDLRELVHRELFQPVWDAAVIQPLGLHLHVEPYRYILPCAGLCHSIWSWAGEQVS